MRLGGDGSIIKEVWHHDFVASSCSRPFGHVWHLSETFQKRVTSSRLQRAKTRLERVLHVLELLSHS